jgi:hypothetical protein
LCWHENETSLSPRRINPFDHDVLTAAIAWHENTFERLQGHSVQLRFALSDGEVFSFWFE